MRLFELALELLELFAVIGEFGPQLLAEVGPLPVEAVLLRVDDLLLLFGGGFALGENPLALIQRLLKLASLVGELL